MFFFSDFKDGCAVLGGVMFLILTWIFTAQLGWLWIFSLLVSIVAFFLGVLICYFAPIVALIPFVIVMVKVVSFIF